MIVIKLRQCFGIKIKTLSTWKNRQHLKHCHYKGENQSYQIVYVRVFNVRILQKLKEKKKNFTVANAYPPFVYGN